MVFKRERKISFKEIGERNVRSEIVDRKTTEEQMNMLGLKEAIDRYLELDGVDMC